MAITEFAPLSERSAEPQLTEMATLSDVMQEVDDDVSVGDTSRYQPMSIGFSPLDDILNDGLRPGELMIVGGASGVGKTIFGLQVARNAVFNHRDAAAMYICYEHDRTHLFLRLLCLESAETGLLEGALTLRKLADMALHGGSNAGLIAQLRRIPRYVPVMESMADYSDRLFLVQASGALTTLAKIEALAHALVKTGTQPLLVVDYLQKIPADHRAMQPETEVTTYLTQGLKELAMTTGLRVVAIAASDRDGLKSRRMRFSDLRGSSALQYEADVGLILNNKYDVVSREHMIYNQSQADAMRRWVVMTVEKNRAGRSPVDMEFALDAAHFRFVSDGDYVRDRLIDEKVTLA